MHSKIFIMRKLLLLFTLLFSVIGFTQALEEGTYTTTAYTLDYANKVEFTFTVFKSDSGSLVVDIEGHDPKSKRTINYANGTTVSWINSLGGPWSESQTFIFTKDVKDGSIYLHWLRVVQNEGEEPWRVFCKGNVYKQ